MCMTKIWVRVESNLRNLCGPGRGRQMGGTQVVELHFDL
jgi:hypothetical protein